MKNYYVPEHAFPEYNSNINTKDKNTPKIDNHMMCTYVLYNVNNKRRKNVASKIFVNSNEQIKNTVKFLLEMLQIRKNIKYKHSTIPYLDLRRDCHPKGSCQVGSHFTSPK